MRVRKLPAVLAAVLLAVGAAGCTAGDDDEPAPPREGWRQLPDGPLGPRDDAVVVGVGDRVLVVGGWEFSCPPNADCSSPEEPLFDDGAVYDATTDSWSTIPDPPFGLRRAEGLTVPVGGSAYLLTGCADGPRCEAPPRLLSYRFADDRWTDHGQVPGPTPPSRGLAALGRTVLVSSGSDELGEVPDLVLDPETSTWSELPDDPLSTTFGRSLLPVGDQLVLTGYEGAALDSPEFPTLDAARLDLDSGQWTGLPDAPGQEHRLLATERGPLLDGHVGGSSAWALDPGTWTWTALPPHRGEGYELRGVLSSDGADYGVGGVTGGVVVYDTGSDTHLTIPPPPGRGDVHGDSATALGRDLVVFGGQRLPGSGRGGDDEPVGLAWLWTAPAG